MSFPNAAQRTDWMQTNHEATFTADQRYGTGHRPAVEPVGAGWSPVCGCPDPKCTRADNDGRLIRSDWQDAWNDAVQNLTDNEHGPRAGQE